MTATTFLVPTFHSDEAAQRYCAQLSVERMKWLWDEYEAWERTDPGCFLLNAVHGEMNRRGEGRYVAV